MASTQICLGDKFYFNNYCVQKHYTIPDYLIVTEIKDEFITAEYENHGVDQRPRIFSKKNLVFDSNLNDRREDPSWIFLKAISQNEQRSE